MFASRFGTPMRIRTRKRLMTVLVILFFAQTWLVYLDPKGRASPALSAEAALGRQIWHDRNCQSCHQLYGFGGFLGPDLTNATERLSSARFDAVLTVGAGQMPAFHLDAAERVAVGKFLAEVGTTGRGQLPPKQSFDTVAALDAAIERAEAGDPNPAIAVGRDVVVAQNCLECHLPNPLSAKEATDLTTLITKLGRTGVSGIVGAGIPAKGMPAFNLAPSDREGLLVFLEWLAANGDVVRETFRDATPAKDTPAGLPWFEYE